MGDRDGDLEAIAESCLEGELPGTASRAVAATVVGKKQDVLGPRIAVPPETPPPLDQTVDGERRRVVRHSDDHVTAVGAGVVETVGDGDADRVAAEVVVVDENGLLGPLVQVVPGFLNWPTSSFFLVSTLITGNCSARNASRSEAMYRN